MRLFLLPISTRRTLIYCERVAPSLPQGQKTPITERLVTRVSEQWAKWEKAEKGWQKQLTVQGNKLFKRIPYEEWGLKSIPPATKKRLQEIDLGHTKFECLYPGKFMKGGSEAIQSILLRLATERQALHRKRMWNSIIIAPFTLPFALVPVIPNIPFFYLIFRAYSHYRALYGGKLLEHLVNNKFVTIVDAPVMDQLYTAGLLHSNRDASREAIPSPEEIEQVAQVVEAQTNDGKEDAMLLQRWNGKVIAERFKLPEMEVEIERAVEQVEKAIQKEKTELEEEKQEVMRAASAAAAPKEVKTEAIKGAEVKGR